MANRDPPKILAWCLVPTQRRASSGCCLWLVMSTLPRCLKDLCQASLWGASGRTWSQAAACTGWQAQGEPRIRQGRSQTNAWRDVHWTHFSLEGLLLASFGMTEARGCQPPLCPGCHRCRRSGSSGSWTAGTQSDTRHVHCSRWCLCKPCPAEVPPMRRPWAREEASWRCATGHLPCQGRPWSALHASCVMRCAELMSLWLRPAWRAGVSPRCGGASRASRLGCLHFRGSRALLNNALLCPRWRLPRAAGQDAPPQRGHI